MFTLQNFKNQHMNRKIKTGTVFIAMLFIVFSAHAQEANKDVSITSSGSGKTMEDAKQAALRSATEQAFGAFISSKTEMFNDIVVADQMASVSSGNIKSYEILNQDQLPDGRWGVTLKAIVSVDKLTSFVQAKGIAIEVKGGMFALNIKQQLINEQGEIKAVAEMIGLLHEPMQLSFDYVINSSDPKSLDDESKNWEIPIIVSATCNKNIDFCANYCMKTLAALSLDSSEVETYKSLNKKVFEVRVTYQNQALTYYLRKKLSVSAIQSLISNWEYYTRLFAVQCGMDESFGNGYGSLFSFSGSDRNYYGNTSWVNINFPTNGQQAATFSWNEKRTLSQIEQMTGYTVKPRGVVSKFKYGGFVISELESSDSLKGTGLILSIYDLGEYNLIDAKKVCDELVLNGYNDWRLPTLVELYSIANYCNRLRIKLGLDENNTYWSSDYSQASGSFNAYSYNIGYNRFTLISPYEEYNVRAVRFISQPVQAVAAVLDQVSTEVTAIKNANNINQQLDNPNINEGNAEIKVIIDPKNNICRLDNNEPLLGNFETFDFRIYNRYGERLYSTKDPHFKWNLQYNGLDMPAGKYFYQLTYQIKRSEMIKLNGSFEYDPPRR